VLLGNKSLTTYLDEQRDKLIGKEMRSLYAPLAEADKDLEDQLADNRQQQKGWVQAYGLEKRNKLIAAENRLVKSLAENKNALDELINKNPKVFAKETLEQLLKLNEFRNITNLLLATPFINEAKEDIDVEATLNTMLKGFRVLKAEIENSTGYKFQDRLSQASINSN